MAAFALVHSPLVGPSTWKLVARRLKELDHLVLVPSILDMETERRPFWRAHAECAANLINTALGSIACCLVGHSGAGPILPAIGARLHRSPNSYIFADASLPQDGASRLDLMRAEDIGWANEFGKYLSEGGRFPLWSDADLRGLIPDDASRQELLTEIKPRDLPFFSEPIPVPEDWPDAPCGYLQFSETYAVPASHARKLGWPIVEMKTGHFHMLVDPVQVADALVQIAQKLRSQSRKHAINQIA